MAALSAPTGFSQIGDQAFICHAASAAVSSSKVLRGPSLVILCTWMGASIKHIEKYTSAWRLLAPESALILIRGPLRKLTYESFAAQRKALVPVLGEIDNATKERKGPLIMHVFSNGGTNTAIQLAITIKEQRGRPLVLGGIILDSCPGTNSYTKSYNALSTVVPKRGLSKYLGMMFAHGILLPIYGLRALGVVSSITEMRNELFDESLFGTTRRLYMYSKADKMVDWHDIEIHAATARARGLVVESVVFQGSPHCGHILESAARYWQAIENLWRRQPGTPRL